MLGLGGSRFLLIVKPCCALKHPPNKRAYLFARWEALGDAIKPAQRHSQAGNPVGALQSINGTNFLIRSTSSVLNHLDGITAPALARH